MPPPAWQLAAALLLDAVIGDPPSWPHPVKAIGRLASWSESLCRRFGNGWLAGAAAVLLVLLCTGGATAALLAAARALHPVVNSLVALYLLYTAVALHDLCHHAMQVQAALMARDLPEARRRVGMIVGRDTEALDEAGVIRAAVESVAENIVDGISAPLFYAALAGPLGAMLYKAVNTLDSLFGYKNDRYRHFGAPAARLDDAVNFLPARLTGLCMVAAAFLIGLDGRNAWRIFRRDRLAHASPNAAHTEAAAAGALGIRLGGPTPYFGRLIQKPFLGDNGRRPAATDIRAACRLARATTLLFCGLLLASILALA